MQASPCTAKKHDFPLQNICSSRIPLCAQRIEINSPLNKRKAIHDLSNSNPICTCSSSGLARLIYPPPRKDGPGSCLVPLDRMSGPTRSSTYELECSETWSSEQNPGRTPTCQPHGSLPCLVGFQFQQIFNKGREPAPYDYNFTCCRGIDHAVAWRGVA